MLIISSKAIISQYSEIEDSVKGSRIIIEDSVRIESFVKIKPVGGLGDIYIGRNSYINSGVVIYSGNGVQIGEDVLIAPNCTLSGSNHQYIAKNKKIIDQRFQPSRGGIIIEDDVWIGANCTILDGAILRKGCVVGACSLVNKELEPYSINFGFPAKKVGYRE